MSQCVIKMAGLVSGVVSACEQAANLSDIIIIIQCLTFLIIKKNYLIKLIEPIAHARRTEGRAR